MKRKVILAILVIAVTIAGFEWFRGRVRQQVRRELVLYGNVDIREVDLGFRVAGRLEAVERDEGDTVRTGDIVARLDDTPYRREVEQARAEVAAAAATLERMETGSRPEDIAQARALVHEREVTAAHAERTLKRAEDLVVTRAVSVQERDDAEAVLEAARARLNSARENLALLEAGSRVEDIALARANHAKAEAALARAELNLEDAVLKSPSAGVVITRAQEPGAILQAGSTVLTVSLEDPVWVRAYVSEPDLGRIHPGLEVEILTDSRPEAPYSGRVGFISPQAEFTPKSVETPRLRTSLVYRLRIVVQDPDEQLRQGMPVTVRVVSD